MHSNLTKRLKNLKKECETKEKMVTELQNQIEKMEQERNTFRNSTNENSERLVLLRENISGLQTAISEKRQNVLKPVEGKIQNIQRRLADIKSKMSDLESRRLNQNEIHKKQLIIQAENIRLQTALRVANFMKGQNQGFNHFAGVLEIQPPGETFENKVDFLLNNLKPKLDHLGKSY